MDGKSGELSPDVIDAGVLELSRWKQDEDLPQQIVEAVFLAMRRAERSRSSGRD